MPGFIVIDKAEIDLADNAEMGIKRGSLLEGLLCFPYESHMLYYFKQSNKVVIIRVLHQNMEPEITSRGKIYDEL